MNTPFSSNVTLRTVDPVFGMTAVGGGGMGQRRSQSSGDGGEISHGRAPARVRPSQKWKLVVIRPLFIQTARSGHLMSPLEPGIGPLMPKVGPCGLGMGLLKYVNCLFSLNVDSERL